MAYGQNLSQLLPGSNSARPFASLTKTYKTASDVDLSRAEDQESADDDKEESAAVMKPVLKNHFLQYLSKMPIINTSFEPILMVIFSMLDFSK